MRLVLVAAVLAGCFSPQPPGGAPCATQAECPEGFTCMFGVCAADDSFAARIGFENPATVVDEMSGTIQVRVVLSHAALVPVSVSYAVVGGTATPNDDFTASDGSLSFAPGETEKAFEITINADTIEEGDETIEIALSDPSGAVIGTATETITISANLLPRVELTTPTASADESMSPTIDVVLDAASPFPITVAYTVSGTATAGGVDYALASGTLTFDPGVTTQSLTPQIVDDVLDEDDETLVVTLSNPVNANLGAVPEETYAILDNDASPTVSFTTATSTTSEPSGTAALNVSLSAASGRTVTVAFAASAAGTATAAADYSYATGSPLTFAAGVTQQTITVSIVQDTVPELDETVITTLATPTNATLGAVATNTLTIGDDDHSCYGSGSYTVCLATPTTAVSLPGTINTDTSTLCQATQPLGWTGQGQAPACVIAGATISGSVQTTVSGTRPLVLVAADSVTLSSTLDVSSRRGGTTGPGSPSLACSPFPVLPVSHNGGAGGGAGGSFMSRGGNGGAGDGGGGTGGTAPAANASPPSVLRAGCDGQLAGKSGNNVAGTIGHGGGAVYLVAGNSITLLGAINASGSAALGGDPQSGGSGAGSGGMIRLYAPTITATGAILIANGGGAASGGGPSANGGAGTDPSVAAPLSPAAGGSASGAGTGGSGFAGPFAATTPGVAPTSGGGGGGGGGGGLIQSNVPLTGATTSAGLVQ